MREEIGQRIKDLRTKQNISQEALGKFLGKSHAAISDIERGKTELSVSDLSLIANFLKVDIDEILNPSIPRPISTFGHSRADRSMSPEEHDKMKRAREEFRNKARSQASGE